VIRRPLVLILAVLLFLGAVGFLAYRPATITGVRADELASSVDGAYGGGGGNGRGRGPLCRQAGSSSRWLCRVSNRFDTARTASHYRVHTEGNFGCWSAERHDGHGPRRLEGCITILDYF
jgi:hypothetical protein